MPPTNQGQSRLLALPRELRDAIYEAYLFVPAGYTYDFDAGKLRAAPGGQPIDLALMYTCQQIGREMMGLALRINVVTFTTLYTDELRTRAGRWDWLARNVLQPQAVTAAVRHLSDESFEKAMQPVDGTTFAAHAREMRPQLRINMDGSELLCQKVSNLTRGEVPSVYRAAERRFMELALADPDLQKYFDNVYVAKYVDCVPGHVPYLLKVASKDPWSIPTEEELDRHAQQLPSDALLGDARYKAFWGVNRSKPRFSAAAAAIHFLTSVPAATRIQLRKVVVHEDLMAVHAPSAHVRGLIPFCHENPALQIERRVDLWRNCFMFAVMGQFPMFPGRWLDFTMGPDDPKEVMSAGNITVSVAKWIVEASLPTIPKAITLVLDGGPDPDLMSRLFQEVVQHDAAWQTAISRVFHSDLSLRGRTHWPYFYEGFPELLQSMSNFQASASVARLSKSKGRIRLP
ncbi:hypothetical protein QBC34DRAFT_411964 [Podospora aff. communis PSN243]|uniref:Uncharacterized protein n=1 Tax=Podospora aff. communis PSN243 TaxID=3040156 RepID=A0AAV9GFF7_9PEZI|nr:hypothetical protein QBC34DRAFT_411964 [Podospora aff. communis PSN243]